MVFFLASLVGSAVRGVAEAVGIKPPPGIITDVLDVVAPSPQKLARDIGSFFAPKPPLPVPAPSRVA